MDNSQSVAPSSDGQSADNESRESDQADDVVAEASHRVAGMRHLRDVKPSDYAIQDGKLFPHQAKLESRDFASWPGNQVEQVVLQPKEHHKVERMLRLSLHVLSYVDFCTVSLYRISDLPDDRLSEEERQDMQDRLTSALNAALRTVAARQCSLLRNVVLARRFSVLKGIELSGPYRSRLLTAPFTGSLFGGTLPSVQKDLKEDSFCQA
ncbi:hypothetical protein CI610_02965 [invertebrate metagenome]|uniref:Uncharacterized protein n=1 Tax=invertebrate metagenome TaxID=1711999 RepID=A0A2H9T4D8_9ZZZZ